MDTVFFQTEWVPSEKDKLLFELATQYHAETEAFDRTVCTGPIRRGSILPSNARELALINKNARAVLAKKTALAAAQGISATELWQAIGKQS